MSDSTKKVLTEFAHYIPVRLTGKGISNKNSVTGENQTTWRCIKQAGGGIGCR